MRPSRSHESLSSPLKSSITSNQIQANYSQNFNKTSSLKSKCQSSNGSLRPSQIENITKLNLSNSSNKESPQSPSLFSPIHSAKASKSQAVLINSIHTSLLNEENCFEIKCPVNTISVFNQYANSSNQNLQVDEDCVISERTNEEIDEYINQTLELHIDEDYLGQENFSRPLGKSNLNSRTREKKEPSVRCFNSSMVYCSRYFMCRTSEEREKWMQCLRKVSQPNLFDERREENSLQVWLLEAKGQPISAKTTKRYFCEIYLNDVVYARTSGKEKKEILFWGESFEFR